MGNKIVLKALVIIKPGLDAVITVAVKNLLELPQPTNPPAPTDPPAPTTATLTGSFMLTDSIDPDAGAFSCTVPDATLLLLPDATIDAYYSGSFASVDSATINNQSSYSLDLFFRYSLRHLPRTPRRLQLHLF